MSRTFGIYSTHEYKYIRLKVVLFKVRSVSLERCCPDLLEIARLHLRRTSQFTLKFRKPESRNNIGFSTGQDNFSTYYLPIHLNKAIKQYYTCSTVTCRNILYVEHRKHTNIEGKVS